MSGWWYTYPSEKYEFVSWHDESPIYGKIKNVPNHQPGVLNFTYVVLQYFPSRSRLFWANHLLVSASSTSGHGFWIRNVQPLGEDIGGTFWWGNSSQSTWSYTLKGTTYHNHPVKSMKCKVSNAYIIMFLELLPSYFRTPLGKTNQTRRIPFSDRLIYNLHGERWTVTLDPTKNGIWSPEIILDPPVPDQLVAQKNPRQIAISAAEGSILSQFLGILKKK